MNAPTAAEPLTTDEQSLEEWVDRFSGHVANLRYDDAAAMMDPEVNSFSTWTDVVVGVDHFVNGQWRNVWPTMTDFVLLTDKMRCSDLSRPADGHGDGDVDLDRLCRGRHALRPPRPLLVRASARLARRPVAGRAGPLLTDEGRPPAVLRLPLDLRSSG